jgi:hypothetical protein
MSTTMIDMEDEDVCMFNLDSPPVVYIPQAYIPPKRCDCSPSNGAVSPVDRDHTYQSSLPPWDLSSPQAMRNEECRRICWSALNLIASYTAQCAAFHQEPMNLYLTEPANVRISYCSRSECLKPADKLLNVVPSSLDPVRHIVSGRSVRAHPA